MLNNFFQSNLTRSKKINIKGQTLLMPKVLFKKGDKKPDQNKIKNTDTRDSKVQILVGTAVKYFVFFA